MAYPNIEIILIITFLWWLHSMIVIAHKYDWRQEIIHCHSLLDIIPYTYITHFGDLIIKLRGRTFSIIRVDFVSSLSIINLI